MRRPSPTSAIPRRHIGAAGWSRKAGVSSRRTASRISVSKNMQRLQAEGRSSSPAKSARQIHRAQTVGARVRTGRTSRTLTHTPLSQGVRRRLARPYRSLAERANSAKLRNTHIARAAVAIQIVRFDFGAVGGVKTRYLCSCSTSTVGGAPLTFT